MENKYRIAMYNLFEDDVIKIKNHLPENFELMEIEDFNVDNMVIEPNVLLINANIKLDKKIKKYCR